MRKKRKLDFCNIFQFMIKLSSNLAVVAWRTEVERSLHKRRDSASVGSNPDKYDNKIKHLFSIFNNMGNFSEQKRLMRLILSGTFGEEPSTRPPRCRTPQHPIIFYLYFLNFFYVDSPLWTVSFSTI